METWHGRDRVTLADERARQQGTQTSTYTGAPVSDPTVGTCRPDAKGDAQMGCPRESKSTDAGHRDGAARSRVESSVMEPDRRGCVVQLSPEVNQQCEEPRG